MYIPVNIAVLVGLFIITSLNLSSLPVTRENELDFYQGIIFIIAFPVFSKRDVCTVAIDERSLPSLSSK
jgi:hypothetical protein